MSLAKSARASQVARNVKNGYYIQMKKFANYGADRRLAEIQAQRQLRKQKI